MAEEMDFASIEKLELYGFNLLCAEALKRILFFDEYESQYTIPFDSRTLTEKELRDFFYHYPEMKLYHQEGESQLFISAADFSPPVPIGSYYPPPSCNMPDNLV